MGPLLTERVCLVTGAGRGIGRETALLMAQEGASLVITDVDEAPLEAVLAEVRAAGAKGVAVAGDVTREGFPEELIRAAVAAYGPDLHVLVNNAGYTWDGMLHTMSDEQWEAMFRVHCTAPFRLLRAAAPLIRENAKREIAEGRRVTRKVVNVSSVAGTDGNPGQANYATAKAGVVGLTKTLAREWGRFNVTVNAVAFGWIETRLTARKEGQTPIRTSEGEIAVGIPAAQRDTFRERIPLGRPGSPQEAAGAILFLASSLSDYVSGQVVKVTGGW